MVVAVGYLATGQAPIALELIKNISPAFMTYYSVRYITFYTAFAEMDMVDILRSQQTWFSYNVAHVIGVIDAVNYSARLSWVADTGERNRRHWMEWVNIGLSRLMAAMITYLDQTFILPLTLEASSTIIAQRQTLTRRNSLSPRCAGTTAVIVPGNRGYNSNCYHLLLSPVAVVIDITFFDIGRHEIIVLWISSRLPN